MFFFPTLHQSIQQVIKPYKMISKAHSQNSIKRQRKHKLFSTASPFSFIFHFQKKSKPGNCQEELVLRWWFEIRISSIRYGGIRDTLNENIFIFRCERAQQK